MFVCQLDEAVGDVPPPVEAHHLGLHVPTGSLQDRTQVSHGWEPRIQVDTEKNRCETENIQVETENTGVKQRIQVKTNRENAGVKLRIQVKTENTGENRKYRCETENTGVTQRMQVLNRIQV